MIYGAVINSQYIFAVQPVIAGPESQRQGIRNPVSLGPPRQIILPFSQLVKLSKKFPTCILWENGYNTFHESETEDSKPEV